MPWGSHTMHFWAMNIHKVPLISISISFNSVTATLENFLVAVLAPLRQDTTSHHIKNPQDFAKKHGLHG